MSTTPIIVRSRDVNCKIQPTCEVIDQSVTEPMDCYSTSIGATQTMLVTLPIRPCLYSISTNDTIGKLIHHLVLSQDNSMRVLLQNLSDSPREVTISWERQC